MLHVGVEDPGFGHLCMVCSASRAEVWHDALYVVLWDRDDQRVNAAGAREGGMVRLCWEHVDELSRLLLEVL